MKITNLLTDYQTDFFVLRTPLTPIDHLLKLNQSIDNQKALQEELKNIFSSKLLQDAIYLASPVLYSELIKLLNNQLTDQSKIYDSLYQYYIRMTTRCTPFGLFAGTNMGEVSENETKLTIHDAQRLKKFVRLDMNYLGALAFQLNKDKEPEAFAYHANSSLYKIGDKLRYTETRFFKDNRSYQITNIDNNELLDLLLEFTRTNQTFEHIIAFIIELGIPAPNAISYVKELITAQVLINNLEGNVTGDDYMDALVKHLDMPSTIDEHGILEDAVKEIKQNTSKDVVLFQKIKLKLEELPAEIDESKLFQMDIAKTPIHCNLNETVVEEIKQCGSALAYLMYDSSKYSSLEKFKIAFDERYENSTVKLTDALDAEIGIDYQSIITNGNIGSPDYSPNSNPIFGFKFSKYQQALKKNATTIEITDQELTSFIKPINLPDSIGVMIKLHPCILEDQTYQLEFKNASGPSAANILGRFCQSEPLMEEKTKEQLRIEESLNPEVIFAEIVHLPQARVGNVLARPHLRKYEIVFLAQSTLESEYIITLDDLYLKLDRGKLVLLSKRLKKEIIPRLSNAHNYSGNNNLQLYQFLCDLQKQHMLPGIMWSWDFLSGQQFLPRVTYKNHILSPALWNLPRKRLEFLTEGSNEEQQQKLHTLFTELQVPMYFYFVEGDNELLLNSNHEFTFKTIKKAYKKGKSIQLKEAISQASPQVVKDEHGQSYTSEIFVPLTRAIPQQQTAPVKIDRKQRKVINNYAVGSEWAYFQVYTGITTADKIIRDQLCQLVQQLIKKGIIDKWFFIRYSDPKFHLRIRFHLTDKKYFSNLMEAIHKALNPLMLSGEVSDLTMRTYKRELERYGHDNIENSEQLFYLNSNCITSLIQIIHQQKGTRPEQKLFTIIYAIDQFLTAFGLDQQERLLFIQQNRNLFAREFRLEQSKDLKNQIQNSYRAHKNHIYQLLSAATVDAELVKGFDEIKSIIQLQSKLLSSPILSIKKVLAKNKEDLLPILASYVHMYVNRFFPANARFQEFIVYEYLERYQISKNAMSKVKTTTI